MQRRFRGRLDEKLPVHELVLAVVLLVASVSGHAAAQATAETTESPNQVSQPFQPSEPRVETKPARTVTADAQIHGDVAYALWVASSYGIAAGVIIAVDDTPGLFAALLPSVTHCVYRNWSQAVIAPLAWLGSVGVGALIGLMLSTKSDGSEAISNVGTGFVVGAVAWPLLDTVLAATYYDVPEAMSIRPTPRVSIAMSRDHLGVAVSGAL